MSKMVDTDVPFSKIEHFLQLDLYQICMQIFNEFAVFAMLSTVVSKHFPPALFHRMFDCRGKNYFSASPTPRLYPFSIFHDP